MSVWSSILNRCIVSLVFIAGMCFPLHWLHFNFTIDMLHLCFITSNNTKEKFFTTFIAVVKKGCSQPLFCVIFQKVFRIYLAQNLQYTNFFTPISWNKLFEVCGKYLESCNWFSPWKTSAARLGWPLQLSSWKLVWPFLKSIHHCLTFSSLFSSHNLHTIGNEFQSVWVFLQTETLPLNTLHK